MSRQRRINSIFHDLRSLAVLTLALSLAACGGGTGAGSPPAPPTYGTLSVALTGTPPDNATKFVLYITKASIFWLRPAFNGNAPVNVKIDEFDVVDPDTDNPGYAIDLTKYSGKTTVPVINKSVIAIDYSFVALTVDWSKSYIEVNGSQYNLTCPNCSGYKDDHMINRIILGGGFNVETGKTMTAVADFDLRQDVYTPDLTQPDPLPFTVIPVVHIARPGTGTSGHVHGLVSDLAMINNNGSPVIDGCYVYIYNGFDVIPDDIAYGSKILASHVNPLKTVRVSNIPDQSNSNGYPYVSAYMSAGVYTFAVTCDGLLDNPQAAEPDNGTDGVTFPVTTNVTVLPDQDIEVNLQP